MLLQQLKLKQNMLLAQPVSQHSCDNNESNWTPIFIGAERGYRKRVFGEKSI